MDEEIAKFRYDGLKWNAPLSEKHADRLLRLMNITPSSTIVDLGCGWASLLTRAVAQTGASGMGVDTDANALARAKREIPKELASRIVLLEEEAGSWHGSVTRAICVGSSHALGGTRSMLSRLLRVVSPRGRVLIGDMFWQKTPSQNALSIFGDELLTFQGLLELCREEGWNTIVSTVADQEEWDAFETGHGAGLQAWIDANPHDARVGGVRAHLKERKAQYHDVYRGILGFAYVVLEKPEPIEETIPIGGESSLPDFEF